LTAVRTVEVHWTKRQGLAIISYKQLILKVRFSRNGRALPFCLAGARDEASNEAKIQALGTPRGDGALMQPGPSVAPKPIRKWIACRMADWLEETADPRLK
jgi:hypothetical protein